MASSPEQGARPTVVDASVFEAILDASPDLLGIIDGDGRLVHLNRAARQAVGIGTDTSLDTVSPASLFRPESWRVIEAAALPVLRRGEVWTGELVVRDAAGGADVPVSAVLLGRSDEQGGLAFVGVLARDLRPERGLEARLRHQADHDQLTGLPNRAPLVARLGEALTGRERFGTPVALLFLDVDRFQVVNDSLGHEAGDQLLVALARRLATAVRPHDRVGRFGADEFVVVCAGVEGPVEAVEVAERLRTATGGRFSLGPGRDGRDREVFVTASVGVALARGGETAEELLRDAEAALYEAKAAGRDRVQLFDAAVRARVLERLDVDRALRHALEREELCLHYQPIVDLPTGTVRGVEALLRWEHPERGLLTPEAFLTVAEDTGLIVELGRWVLTEACRLVASVPPGQGSGLGLPVFVNLSARQLADPGLVSMVREVIDLTGVEPARVHLEITEDALMADAETTTATLAALRSVGVRIALDDFGTGHSSLAYLKHFPVEVLKIDRAFIEGLGRDIGDAAITGAIVDVARVLGLATVAEGVERVEQAEALVELGCALAQGYHLARPMPAERLIELLGRRRS